MKAQAPVMQPGTPLHATTLTHPVSGEPCLLLAHAWFEADASPAIVAREACGTRVWVWSARHGVDMPVQGDDAAAPARTVPSPGEQVVHVRSGDHYRILYWGHTADARALPVCVYQSLQDERVWVRNLRAMCDGRFQHVPEACTPADWSHPRSFAIGDTRALVSWPVHAPAERFVFIDVIESDAQDRPDLDSQLVQRVLKALTPQIAAAVPMLVMRHHTQQDGPSWCACECESLDEDVTFSYVSGAGMAEILGLLPAELDALLPRAAALQG